MTSISKLVFRISKSVLKRPNSHAFACSNPLSRTYNNAVAATTNQDEEDLEMIDQRRLPADYDPSKFDPTEHRSPPTDRVFRLVDEVSGLTLLEVAELSSILMKKMGMKEPPVVGVMKAGAAAAGVGVGVGVKGGGKAEEKQAEKTVFEVKLEGFEAAAKIKVIKEVRGFTDLGLKEAKELVEKAPAVIKSGVSKEEGEKIVEKMMAVGAKVVLE
ncbi:hypothetical protein Syun_014853 [Stephania yunnanensis]|uniref:Ribosomal protein L7/L12 C-terminal domain-containing protein n=1 Tax=Stephania yunnanensis TaxID=152371 RepID=A0AAP0JK40_9MAGN